MKTYTECIEHDVCRLITDAFNSVMALNEATNVTESLKNGLYVHVSLTDIGFTVYCDCFTATFLSIKLENKGFKTDGYKDDTKHITFMKEI